MNRWRLKGWRCERALGTLALVCALAACMTTTAQTVPLPMTEADHCDARGGTWDVGRFKGAGYCAKGTPSQCQAIGGNWQRVCMMGTLFCVQAFADAGKACQSGVDCQGKRCLQRAEARGQEQAQSGRCIANNNPCYFGINLEKGLPVPTAVAD